MTDSAPGTPSNGPASRDPASRAPPRQVVKAGGSILRDAEHFRRLAERAARLLSQGPALIVVSAARGVTERLIHLAPLAAAAPEQADREAAALLAEHATLGGRAVPLSLQAILGDGIRQAAAGSHSPLVAWGELASAHALRARLADLGVDVPVRELQVGRQQAAREPGSAIVPGFYLRDRRGHARLLPRGGSDISALLLATWSGARTVRLWKDGGGIRDGPEGAGAQHIASLGSARLLQRLGRTIHPLHPAAVRIAQRHGITLILEDPWDRHPATRVVPDPVAPPPVAISPSPLPGRNALEVPA